MKKYNIIYGIGKVKYVVNFHDGEKKHLDGSNFYDIRLFNSQAKMASFIKSLKKNGYQEGRG